MVFLIRNDLLFYLQSFPYVQNQPVLHIELLRQRSVKENIVPGLPLGREVLPDQGYLRWFVLFFIRSNVSCLKFLV